ncbi:hypothetical protein GCM10011609_51590 [Lentzea pudingi]|uniref:Uncharacterized protein n=1 Tax=Lentzea pudingi TaxID=1789439 RepID=A0ABQ2IF44_9PSEU|nr:hypothetical protein GCM10011609_51590 [Lentzea pudingi]
MAFMTAIARFTSRASTTVRLLSPEPCGFSLMDDHPKPPDVPAPVARDGDPVAASRCERYCIRVTFGGKGNIRHPWGVLQAGSAPGGTLITRG